MFWGGKKKEDDKEKQIKQLKNAFPSMRRPNNDDNCFELRFSADHQYNMLRVVIPEDFPASRPVLQVIGPVNHHWLDGSKLVVGCKKLNEWNKASNINEVVESCIQQLMTSYIPSNSTAHPQTQPHQPPSQPVQQPIVQPSNMYPQGAGQPGAVPIQQPPYGQPNYPGMYNNPNNAGAPGYGAYPGGAMGAVANNYGYPTAGPATNVGMQPLNFQSQYTIPGAVPAPYSAGMPPAGNNANYPMIPTNNGMPVGPGVGYNNIPAPAPLPPKPAAVPQVSAASAIAAAAAAAASGVNSASNSMKSNSSSQKKIVDDEFDIPIPDPPQSFPELENLTDTQLERLVADPVAIEAMVCKMDSVVSMKQIRDQVRESNGLSASKNVMTMEDHMEMQRKMTDLQKKLKSALEKYAAALSTAEKLTSSDNSLILQELQPILKTMDEQSDEIGQKFIRGDIEVQVFMKDFLDLRSKFHALELKTQLVSASLYR